VSENPPWLDKFNRYWKDAVFIHEGELWTAQFNRNLAKWWLEFIRNLLVASAFYFLAEKSGSIILKTLAAITYVALLSYVISYTYPFSVRLFPYIKNQRWNLWINLIAWTVIWAPIFFSMTVGLAVAFETLSKIAAGR